MKPLLPLVFLLAAAPAWAQIRALPEKHILRNAPAGTEEETPAAQAPVNLRPTQLLRCPDGKGGIVLQDTPCKAPTPPAGAAPASAAEIVELSALPPRPQVEPPAPRVDDGEGLSRWTKGALYGAGKLALLVAAIYGIYRLARYGRERLQQRFPEPDLASRAPRRVR